MTHMITDAVERGLGGEPNLSTKERAISLALGLGLAAAATKPRPNPLLNLLALAGGSILAWRGASGHCVVKAALSGEGTRDRIADERGQRLTDAARRVA